MNMLTKDLLVAHIYLLKESKKKKLNTNIQSFFWYYADPSAALGFSHRSNYSEVYDISVFFFFFFILGSLFSFYVIFHSHSFILLTCELTSHLAPHSLICKSLLHSNFFYISYICIWYIRSLFFMLFVILKFVLTCIGQQFSSYWWVIYSLKISIVRICPCSNHAAAVHFSLMESPQHSGNIFPHVKAPTVIWNPYSLVAQD